ncbi:MAG: hypothetical protein H7123_04460, partial [Thermoleophilia bacterium]|nr:hypothetical protein [Thermoleophilia bacterium]
MATQSRARMFHATAKALRSAADQRLDSESQVFSAEISDIDFNMDLVDLESTMIEEAAPAVMKAARWISADDLQQLHTEFRWAESRLMQSSERLAEAQEARRKDLVALACMRRELRASFEAERHYTRGQMLLFAEGVPRLDQRETELNILVGGGALTANVIRDLAVARAERKLFALALGQCNAQLARIDEADFTLEYDVANEAYDREPDGASMRELARLRSESTRARRESVAQAKSAIALRDELGVDTTYG